MGRIISRPLWFWILTASLSVSLSPAAVLTAGESDRTVQKTPKKPHGRLPAYYRLVVSEEQRAEIYRIQSEYRDRVESLQDRLNKLKEERDAKIERVLSEEQKKQVEEAAAEAKAKRASKTKKKGAARAGKDSAPPSTRTLPAR